MEGAGGVVPVVRAKAVRGAEGFAAWSDREGAGVAIAAAAGRWSAASTRHRNAAAEGHVFTQRRGERAGAVDGRNVRLGKQTLGNSAEFAKVAKREQG